MTIEPITPTFTNFKILQTTKHKSINEPCEMVTEFCKTFVLPNKEKNYAQYDEKLAKKIASYKDAAIAPVTDMLKTAKSEKDITAGLLLLNRIYDEGAKKDWKIYPEISKFNYSKSPNVQVMLAGIYRKTQVPDAFGPLTVMLFENAKQKTTQSFDPNEEIGGAILEYLRNSASTGVYRA